MLHLLLPATLPLLAAAGQSESLLGHDAPPTWRLFEDAPPADMAAIAAVERAVLEVYGTTEGGPRGGSAFSREALPLPICADAAEASASVNTNISSCTEPGRFDGMVAGQQVLVLPMQTARRHDWSVSALLAQHGDALRNLSFALSERYALSPSGPSPLKSHRIPKPRGDFGTLLSKLLAEWRVNVFDSKTRPPTDTLVRALPVPEAFRAQAQSTSSAWEFGQGERRQTCDHVVSSGSLRSGLPFHTHGDTWLVSLVGRKRWFVFPPGKATGSARGNAMYGCEAWVHAMLRGLSPEDRPYPSGPHTLHYPHRAPFP